MHQFVVHIPYYFQKTIPHWFCLNSSLSLLFSWKQKLQSFCIHKYIWRSYLYYSIQNTNEIKRLTHTPSRKTMFSMQFNRNTRCSWPIFFTKSFLTDRNFLSTSLVFLCFIQKMRFGFVHSWICLFPIEFLGLLAF